MKKLPILVFFILSAFILFAKDYPVIKFSSNAFKNGGFIPVKYTCDSKNVSPYLYWESKIKGIKSYVIIADDPDAPMGTWVHWVVYDIPAKVSFLAEALPKEKILKNGIKQGKTSFGDFGYGGPCPPSGTHRYFFKIYALDIPELDITPDKANKNVILEKIKGHIIGYGELMGKYKRKK